jgi:hypothetical protein
MNKQSRPDDQRNGKPTVFPFRPLFNYIEDQTEAISEPAIGLAGALIMASVLYWICTLFHAF